MRGVTPCKYISFFIIPISIHTPHAGSDETCVLSVHESIISIHTPHAGSDGVWRKVCLGTCHISIHTPHAGSDMPECFIRRYFAISIHTPHAGSDAMQAVVQMIPSISIHTPHAGSDYPVPFSVSLILYFNPHSPCGE